ncbi:uncharacterized protein LOC107271335 [Cephus cinctus]|uniref:Uncharacterized protein LOC107271335 n=1 Tax=Cephus cinctus TaxID=211228 RepID=A0AAJ7C626_CEPCN|nr:uncharacterized protein LOC107271335 [Cephus cinctus]
MSDSEYQDPLTRLNTTLNKSMAFMETSTKSPQNSKSNKAVKINTKSQPRNATKSVTSRKSILKKRNSNDENSEQTESLNVTVSNGNSSPKKVQVVSRPKSLKDLLRNENLAVDSTESTYGLEDLSDNEEIWLMNIPRTINPRELENQSLYLGDRSKFRIGEERYYAVNCEAPDSLTCVFNTSKPRKSYKTVNLKMAGTITVRRKLPGVLKIKPEPEERSKVPFPKNIKKRHPLFGACYKRDLI